MAINKTATAGQNISFSGDIENEFGQNATRSLGDYRVSKRVGDFYFPLDEGIPTSGAISFADFAGKRLNIVVHFGTSGSSRATEISPNAGYQRFRDDGEGQGRWSKNVVIGGFKNKPSTSQTNGKRIIIHVSGKVGGEKSTTSTERRNSCALRTGGNWQSGTTLDIEIGNQGRVIGGGGDGGRGGNDGETGGGDNARRNDATGQDGLDGSSALKVAYTVERLRVQNGGLIMGGGGGGGGSGGARNEEERIVAGAGGGGGAGIPAGEGGSRGEDGGAQETSDAGSDGSELGGGAGGKGGFDLRSEEETGAKAGGGGGGGSPYGNEAVGPGGLRGGAPGNGNARDDYDGNGENGETSRGGEGGRGDAEGEEQAEGPGGDGGNNGYAIVYNSGKSINEFAGAVFDIKGGTNTV